MNKNIIGYKILDASNLSSLEELVLKEIGSGWQPLGSMKIGNESFGLRYFQTMVKYSQ